MTFCGGCGARLNPGNKFCGACGRAIILGAAPDLESATPADSLVGLLNRRPPADQRRTWLVLGIVAALVLASIGVIAGLAIWLRGQGPDHAVEPQTAGDVIGGQMEAVTLDAVCEAVPVDAHSIVLAGQAHAAGQMSLAQLQQSLSVMQLRWTPAAEATNLTSNMEGAESHLAGTLLSLLDLTSFAANQGEQPIVSARDWTGGDLSTEYHRVCGRTLSGS